MFMADTMNQLLNLVGSPDLEILDLPKKLAFLSIAIYLGEGQRLNIACVARNLRWFLFSRVARTTIVYKAHLSHF